MAAELSFSQYLADIRARSVRTVEAYSRDVGAFAAFCESRQWEPVASLTKARVGQYIMQRTETGRRAAGQPARLTARSSARIISALSAYGGYLVFTGALRQAQLEQLKPPKYTAKLPAYFNVGEIVALVSAFDGDTTPRGMRSAAVLHLIYSAGLRVGECAGLQLGALDLQRRLLSVTGKGGRQREVPFGQQAAARLERYLREARPQLARQGSGSWVWLGPRGGRLAVRTMQRVLDEAAARVGCVKPVSPHKLRHACATHMLEGGADVRLLQELLGHQSLNTTQVYTQITRTKLLEVYDRTHPRAR